MRKVITFTLPLVHKRCKTISDLARLLDASFTSLKRMARLGVIEPYRGAYDSEDCCARLAEYNRQAMRIKAIPGISKKADFLDMTLIRQAGTKLRDTSIDAPVTDGPPLPGIRVRQNVAPATPVDGAVLEQYPDEALLKMVRDSTPDGLPGEDPITRKHRLEGDKAALLIATRRGLLIERAAVMEQIAQVSEVVIQELSDFCREIDAGYMGITDPEERIEWGQEQLRERLDRVIARFRSVGGQVDGTDAD